MSLEIENTIRSNLLAFEFYAELRKSLGSGFIDFAGCFCVNREKNCGLNPTYFLIDTNGFNMRVGPPILFGPWDYDKILDIVIEFQKINSSEIRRIAIPNSDARSVSILFPVLYSDACYKEGMCINIEHALSAKFLDEMKSINLIEE